MSEEAKIALIREKINEARCSARNWNLIGLMFAIFVAIELVYAAYLIVTKTVVSIETANMFGPITVLLLIPLGISSIIGSVYYSGIIKPKLLAELEKMTVSIPKCSSCNKEIPEGKFEFCPHCGKSLKV